MKELKIITRHYSLGDEEKIVEFLNLCYGRWGDINKWRYLYIEAPTFTNDNIIIMEHEGEIIGHGGMHIRELKINDGGTCLVAIFSDGAVHPNYRGMRLHSKLLNNRFNLAKAKGVGLCLGWVMKDSAAYKSDIKSGFREIGKHTLYMKIINPEKILKIGLIDALNKNVKLKENLLKMPFEIKFALDEHEFDLRKDLVKIFQDKEYKDWVKIILSKKTFLKIMSFRGKNRFRRNLTLLYLLITRNIKVKFNSSRSFFKNIFKLRKILSAL